MTAAPKKILIIQTAFLGDLILLSSLFRLLRARFPEAELFAVMNPIGTELYEHNPWGVKLVIFDKRGTDKGPIGLWKLSRELRQFQADWCICLHRYSRSSLLALLSGAREVYGFKEAPFSLFFSGAVDRNASVFEAEKNLSVVQAALSRNEMDPIQVNRSGLYPELLVQEEDVAEALEVLPNFHNTSYVVISPSSAWTTKRWPAERFANVARQLYEQGQNVLLVGGQSEEDELVNQELSKLLAIEIKVSGDRDNWLKNMIGKTSIGSLRALISNAKLVLCNDSAPMHLATAYDRPCIAIFGPTTKELGFFPLAKSAETTILERRLDCRPCGLHGHKNCPKSHFRCMLEVDVANVIRTVESTLCP